MLWKLPVISLAPEVIATPFGFPITNTLFCSWITIIGLVVFFYFGTRRRDLIPSGFQNFVEWVIEFLLGLVEGISGKEKGKKFFPLVATFFIFIVACNLLDVVPGVDTIGTIHQHEGGPVPQPVLGIFLFGESSNQLIPWIRPATTDLNLTLAMAVTSVVMTQAFSFMALGPKEQLGKYFNFGALKKGPLGLIEIFAGLIEVVSEVARIISFAFRLFGNIFAGSALLAVFAFLLPFVGTLVFIPFELFVAVIQAFVFSMLTLVFMEIGTSSHSHAATEHEAQEAYEEQKEASSENVVAQR